MKNYSFLQKFLSGESHIAFWNVVSKGTGFLNTLFILSSLTLYQYGVFQLLLSAYGIFLYFNTIGGDVAANDMARFVGEHDEPRAKKLFFEYYRFRFFLSAIFFALFFFGAPILSFKYQPDFILFIQTISFLFLTETILHAGIRVLSLRLQFQTIASRGAVQKMAQLCVLAAFFLFSRIGTQEVLISMILASVISALFFLLPALRAYKPWKTCEAAKERILLPIFRDYGKWDIARQTVAKIIGSAQPWLIKILISTEAVAIFSYANTLITLIKDAFPTRTLSTLIPMELSDKSKAQKIFTFGTKYLLLLSLAAAALSLIFVPPLTHIFFEQYAPALPLFYLMLISLPFSAVSILAILFIIALRKQKFLFAQSVSKNILVLLGTYVFATFFGIWGLALERIATTLFMFLSSYWYLRTYKTGIAIRYREILRFGEEDRVLLTSIVRNLHEALKKKFPSRS